MKSKLLDQFYQLLIRDLEQIDKDFEVLLNSKALRIVASLSTRLFQKHADRVITAFSNVMEIYQEEYESIILEVFSPLSLTDKNLLQEKQKAYLESLTQVLMRLNVKAEILIKDLKASNLHLDSETQNKLEEICTCTAQELLSKFKQV